MSLRSWSAKAFALLPLLVGDAFAQTTTNATCGIEYRWMNNALGQSPCLVAAYLGGVCGDGGFSVDALPGPGSSYQAPSGIIVDPCMCTTIVYNLVQACSTCQHGVINSWLSWIENCPQTYIGKTFPYPIPAGTQVSTWADMDPSTVGFWSPTMASAYAVGPSASITPGSTSLSPTSTVAPTTVYIPATPTNPGTQRSASAPPIGAIVGGAVGGMALLLAVGLGIWFSCLRNQRRSQQIQPDMSSRNTGGMYSAALPGQMSPTTPGSLGTSSPLQQPLPHYPFYPPPSETPSSPIFNQGSPASNHDAPSLLDANSMRQSFYPQHVEHQGLGQFSSPSPQASPPPESSTFTPPGVQRTLSMAPPYKEYEDK